MEDKMARARKKGSSRTAAKKGGRKTAAKRGRARAGAKRATKRTAKRTAKRTTKRTAKRATKKATRRGGAKKRARKTARKGGVRKRAAAKKGGRKKRAARRTGARRAPNPAFMKPVQPSPQLSAIVGSQAVPRTEITKRVWDYIRKNGLQDSTNRRMINADDRLREVFGGRRQVSMFEMTKLISQHLS